VKASQCRRRARPLRSRPAAATPRSQRTFLSAGYTQESDIFLKKPNNKDS